MIFQGKKNLGTNFGSLQNKDGRNSFKKETICQLIDRLLVVRVTLI